MSPTSDAIAAIQRSGALGDVLQLFAALPEELKGDQQVRGEALTKIQRISYQDGSSALDVIAMPTGPARKDAAMAAIERSEATYKVVWLFAAFPEELKGDKHVCKKALAKVVEMNRHDCDRAIELFAMFTGPVRKDVDIQNMIIDMLKFPVNSGNQGPFLAEILDGSKDDVDIVLRCCSAWKPLWQVKDVLKKLPDALKADAEFQKQFVHDVDLSPTSDAIAALAAVGPPEPEPDDFMERIALSRTRKKIGTQVLEIFAAFPEELKKDKHVCEKAVAKIAEYDTCNGDSAVDLFAMFTGPVRKDVDVQDIMIDMLSLPINSHKQGPFLAELLDGSKDDADTVLRCFSAWKGLWQVKDVLQKLPDALKADAEFQKQFVHAVDLGFQAIEVLRFFPGRTNDISFCTLLVEKCGVERRSGGIGNHHTDGSSVPMLYRQFSEQVQSDTGMQKLVFEKCSAYGMPMLFQFWPHALQMDPVVRGEFLNKCHDETKMYLFKAFVEALPNDIPLDVDLQRRFIESTGEAYLHKVFAELPEASKNNLDLVYACLDSPKLTSGIWLKYLFEAFPDGVKREPLVQQRCLDKFSREELGRAFDGADAPGWARDALQAEPPEAWEGAGGAPQPQAGCSSCVG